MKYCFLVTGAPYLMEFLGKFSDAILKEGDECLLVANGKMAEFEKLKYFSKRAKIISKVDWCIANYKPDKKEFGRLSWREFFMTFDRFNLDGQSYDRSINLVNQVYQFFEFIFKEEKPDVIISEPPSDLFDEIAYYFSRKNNKPYLGFIASRFNRRIDIYDLETDCSKFKKTFDNLKITDIKKQEKEFSDDFVVNFISHKQLPPYVLASKIHFSQMELVNHYWRRIRERGKPILKYFASRSKYKNFDYEGEAVSRRSPFAFLIAQRKKFRIFLQKRLFKNPGDESFFVFPLHFQPEASTLVQATYYVNQLNTIKNIAFSLPLPYKLYVKEHPGAVGTRQSGFYRELKKTPNVVLISPASNVEELIKKSAGVITLTSTLGLEAAFSGKTVYVLGDIFYAYHPCCRKVINFSDLKNKLQEDILKRADNINLKELKEINARFIISYFKNTVEGNIAEASTSNDSNDYQKIYQDIKHLFLT
jgi:hypothetical protein